MRYAITLTTAVVLFLATSVMSLEADQVRGKIVSVDDQTLSLRVDESGDRRAASPGDVNEYQISDDTRVVFEDPGESVIGTQAWTVEDLRPGTEVVLAFEDVNGQLYARDVSMSDAGASGDRSGQDPVADQERETSESDIAAMEGSEQRVGAGAGSTRRSQLPDTASILPLLAAGGAGFGLVALVLRLVRRRRR